MLIYEGMKACLELINSYKMNNQKVLLFSTFTKVFDLFEEDLFEKVPAILD